MDWGEGQGSQGSWTPNLPSDLYSVALRVGSALGMDGRKELPLRGDDVEGLLLPEPFYGRKSLTTMTQLPQHGVKHQLPHLHGKKKTQRTPIMPRL